MIISHKHYFIFIKPKKVAGTSIEIALGKLCGQDDIITPITEYNPTTDSSEYEKRSINFRELDYYNHITPDEIKQKIGEKIWNEYYKFTIVRNPWDQMVSHYFWRNRKRQTLLKKEISKNVDFNIFSRGSYVSLCKIVRQRIIKFNILSLKSYISLLKSVRKRIITSRNPEYDFEKFLKYFKSKWTNTKYYFDKKGNPICDFYIRFENLNEDYKKVCNELGLPYEELPMTKNKPRNEQKHYSEFYTPKLKNKVNSLSKKEIEYFKYTFESV